MFLDIGGVLFTDGWDRHARKRAATHLKLELTDFEERHQLIWDSYQQRGNDALSRRLP
jgi:putative hydrolase of the HAD superfamily